MPSFVSQLIYEWTCVYTLIAQLAQRRGRFGCMHSTPLDSIDYGGLGAFACARNGHLFVLLTLGSHHHHHHDHCRGRLSQLSIHPSVHSFITHSLEAISVD